MTDDEAIRKAVEAQKARFVADAAAKAAARFEEIQRAAAEIGMALVPSDSVVQAHTPIAPEAPALAPVPNSSPGPQTFAELVDIYFTDKRSSFHKNRFRTRKNYESIIKTILPDCGHFRLADVSEANILELRAKWMAGGKLPMARYQAMLLRMIVKFGSKVLNERECDRIAYIMHKMEFILPEPQSAQKGLTREQVVAIIERAHEVGLSSIALAQALQFDCRKLRQRDVIGEWVPIAEHGPMSDVLHPDNGKKWVRGIKWSDIDDDYILRHTLSFHEKKVEIDLRKAPMVMKEIMRRGRGYGNEPVIVSEHVKRPWDDNSFRDQWRKIATAVGVPKNIKNMNSRIAKKRRSGLSENEEEPEKGRPAIA